MPFPILTVTEIVNDFFQSLKDSGSRLGNAKEGSRIYFIARAIGVVVSKAYAALNTISNEFFISQATGTALRRRVRDFNMIPDPGALAAGAVIAKAPPGQTLIVSAGDLLYTEDQVYQFEILSDAVLGESWTHIPIIASDVGAQQNLPAGTPLYSKRSESAGARFVVSFDPPTNGLPSGQLRGGRAAETDEQIKARFPSHLKSFARGVKYAVFAALQNVPGLRVVDVRNADPVPGWFTIVTGNDSSELTEALRDSTDLVLQEWAALGYGFGYETLERRPVLIEVKAKVSDRTIGLAVYEDQIVQAISQAVSALVQGESLYRSEIVRAGKVAGVVDLEVVKPASSVIVSSSEVVVAEGVSVSADYV